ncbi:hypothetical protein N7530_003612 [Penicillium desertorum]|uniref:Uncharacterized protein n=1 Tax=Penicillium desertorum TaxID=1303715 RepID=A0A9X0BPQ6_9EURO|nr:hypothetical protein N7530_003612 [Penicillium desertorum]
MEKEKTKDRTKEIMNRIHPKPKLRTPLSFCFEKPIGVANSCSILNQECSSKKSVSPDFQ